MWIFLNNAFVSAVQHNDDPDLLVVRARVEGDLERFFVHWGPVLSVERHEDRDYLFRTIVPKETFARSLGWHVSETDYGNFKDSIGTGDDDPHEGPRHDAYLRVWSAMNWLQGKLHGAGRYVGQKYVG